MKYSDEQVLETLRQDPIADAEKIVGHSWKEDPDGLNHGTMKEPLFCEN